MAAVAPHFGFRVIEPYCGRLVPSARLEASEQPQTVPDVQFMEGVPSLTLFQAWLGQARDVSGAGPCLRGAPLHGCRTMIAIIVVHPASSPSSPRRSVLTCCAACMGAPRRPPNRAGEGVTAFSWAERGGADRGRPACPVRRPYC